ncbi:DUF654-domain-containing protein [Hypomontagnella monticulosa]|nr:DUF654-domain-containing protein [Hypomontagnella monticulosa]
MSSRQLRKLQKQKELQELQASSLAESDDSSDEELPAPKPKTNLFSGFAALGNDDDQGNESDHDENEDEIVETTAEPKAQPDATNTSKTSSKKSKSKKKKKKAKKQEPTPTAAEPTSKKTGPDEIDRALKELNLRKESKDSPLSRSQKSYERVCELLSINTYHLKVINEMRNLFGRETIAAAQTEEQEQARQQMGRGMPDQVDLETYLKGQPGKSLPEVTLRRNPFLTGKESWPQASTEGLAMVQVKETDDGAMSVEPGTVEFRFAHSASYNELENNFFSLAQMHDPMQIVHFLHRHPYHISSLIQVSKIAEQDQNLACAADLCERALFTFGRVSLSAFRQKIEQGKARLSFKRPENRQFWLAAYHYLKHLIKKGTNRTALEWAKLLLSMDPTDPYGIVNFIHPLAIRAHEAEWLIKFCSSDVMNELRPSRSMSIIRTSYDIGDYLRQTEVLAKLQQGDTASAKVILVEGIEIVPWLYHNLFKALNLDVPKCVWGRQPRSREEDLYTSLYIHQTKELWNNTQAISLLKEAASEARRGDEYVDPAQVTSELARFAIMLGIPSLIGLVPQRFLGASTSWEFDPVPPPLSENIFSHESQKIRFTMEGMEDRLRFVFDDDQDLAARMDQFMEMVDDADNDDNDGSNDGDEDGDGPVGVTHNGLAAVYRTFMNMISPQGAASDPESDQENIGAMPMPGGLRDASLWDESDDDEDDEDIPPLIPGTEAAGREANNRGGADDGTDDDLPDLV